MLTLARIFLLFGLCALSVNSSAYMHSEEQLARKDKETDEIRKALDTFSKDLSGELLSRYKSLRYALNAYATAHAENELDAAGTGWADSVVAGKENTQKEFIILYRKLDSKQLKPQSKVDSKKIDAELIRYYRAIQKDKSLDSEVAAAPSREGISKTQGAWIHYRDAWFKFATLKFPTVSKHALNAALSGDRIAILKDLAID